MQFMVTWEYVIELRWHEIITSNVHNIIVYFINHNKSVGQNLCCTKYQVNNYGTFS